MIGKTPNSVVDDDSARPRHTLRRLAILVVCGSVLYWALGAYREARNAAVRSYLCSVCAAVEDYKQQHGEYPADLTQISASKLDVDFGITVASLAYEVDDSTIMVSYFPEAGKAITCQRPATLD